MSETDPRVSIVAPMFNVEKYIDTCIKSILSQTFSDFELIIVDDCSTDRSSEIVRNYTDPRIKLFCCGKNGGAGSARNFGIDLAHGEFIYFIDPDDAILPDTLETFVKAAEESQADIIYMNHHYRVLDQDFNFPSQMHARVFSGTDPTPRIFSEDLISRLQHEYFRCSVMVQPWMKIQRRKFLLEHQIYFPTIPRLDDMLFNFAEICFARKIQVIDACKYLNRINPTSIMNASAENGLRKAIQSMPPALKYMEDVMSRCSISKEFQIQVEGRILLEFFNSFLRPAYNSMTIERVNEILFESLAGSNDLNLTRMLIHTVRFLLFDSTKVTVGK